MTNAAMSQNTTRDARRLGYALHALRDIAGGRGLRAHLMVRANIAARVLDHGSTDDEPHELRDARLALGMIANGDRRYGATGRRLSKSQMVAIARQVTEGR